MSVLKSELRQLRMRPGFALVAIATLAFGIGGNISVFSLVDAVLIRDLPYSEADRLGLLETVNRRTGAALSVSLPDFLVLSEQTGSNASMAAWSILSLDSLSESGEPERLRGCQIIGDFFQTLAAQPASGRSITAGENRPGSPRVAVLSHRLWTRRFGEDGDVSSKSIVINGQTHAIVGVMAPGFGFPDPGVDLWFPRLVTENDRVHRNNFNFDAIVRLEPGSSFEQTERDFESVYARLRREYPTKADLGPELLPLQEERRKDMRLSLWTLLGAMGFALLIACLNLAGLLLARFQTRRAEFALRRALGAGTLRVVSQLFCESLLLAGLGGLAGLLLAGWLIEALTSMLPHSAPQLENSGIGARSLGFGLAIALASGLVFALPAAWAAMRSDSIRWLKAGGRGGGSGLRSWRAFGSLLSLQVALTLVLLSASGLLLESFRKVVTSDPGFEPKGVLSMRIHASTYRYPESSQVPEFYRQVLEQVRETSGVLSASIANSLPAAQGQSSGGLSIRGKQLDDDGITWTTQRIVSEDYFQTLKIPLVSGRYLQRRDGQDSPPAVVVNQSFVDRFLPGEEPLGHLVSSGGSPFGRIVGVVADTLSRGLESEPPHAIYQPHEIRRWRGMTLLVRAEDPEAAASLAAPLRAAVQRVDPQLPVAQVQLVEEAIAGTLSMRRGLTLLLSAFSGLAMGLALLGIIGALAYAVRRKSGEIGVRMALGARQWHVVSLVLRRGMVPVAAGLSIGAVAALQLTQYLEEMLFGVSAGDARILIVAALLLCAGSLAACCLPARMAARIPPLEALRTE